MARPDTAIRSQASIALFGSVTIDFVGFSTFRVPIARIAAAQAAG